MCLKHPLIAAATLGLLLFLPAPARAQLVNDTATNTLNNVTNTLLGDLIVGTNGPFTTLLLTNTARVNATNGIIGLGATSASNLVFLTGTNTVWSNSGFLTIGATGSVNRLVISNGATVFATDSFIGSNAASTNNLVIVTGTNSMWSNSGTLTVGDGGSFNTLIVTNAARVVATSFSVGDTAGSGNNVVRVGGTNSVLQVLGDLTFGSNGVGNQFFVTDGARLVSGSAVIGGVFFGNNNLMHVAGPGTVWTNTGTLTLGRGGPANVLVVSNGAGYFSAGSTVMGTLGFGNNNRLIVTGPNTVWSNRADFVVGNGTSTNLVLITNGAVLISSNGYLGVNAGANGNGVTVTGTNSLWRVYNDITIGLDGTGNNVTITNGGSVIASNRVTLGTNSGTANTLALGPGSTLTVSNVTATAALDAFGGGIILRGGTIIADRLFITNGLGSMIFDHGLLITRGGLISNGVDFIVGNVEGTNTSTWDVRSNTAATVLFQNMTLGAGTPGTNLLLITNGATLSAPTTFATIGGSGASSNNLAIVARSNSSWSMDTLTIGLASSGNGLVVSNGGRVATTTTLNIGDGGESSFVVVTGTNTFLTNGGDLNVGFGAANAQLLVTNSGRVDTLNATVGRNPSGVGGTLTVAGIGSRMNVSNDLTVGFDSSYFNTLVISNSGVVTASNTFINRSDLSVSNTLLVIGTNAFLTNRTDLRVGDAGSFGLLLITNGARVAGNLGTIGFLGSATFNTVIVDGTNSTWSNRGTLLVGRAGNDSLLLITNGALVQAAAVGIGTIGGAGNNLGVVTGPTSRWTNSGTFTVGGAGVNNRLSILDGSVVFSSNAVMGTTGGGLFGISLVSGSNSVWTNTAATNPSVIGLAGRANTLTLDNGGRFFATALTIGGAPGGSNNLVSVVGTGAVLVATNSIEVSLLDAANQLFITGGGVALTSTGRVGGLTTNTNSLGGFVLVRDPGSFFSNGVSLTIGDSGVSNLLVISNGAAALVRTNLIVGVQPTSSNNLVAIRSSTLTVANANATGTLDVRNGSVLFNGGVLTVDRLLVTNAAGPTNQGGTFDFVGGVFTNRGGLVSNSLDFVIGISNGVAPATWDLRTGAGTMSVVGNLVLGAIGRSNSLFITNGQSLLVASNSIVAQDALSSNNVAFISGAGSLWSSANTFTLGDSGPGNLLTVNTGAVVSARTNFIVGATSNSVGNVVLVTGGGITVSNGVTNGVLDVRRGSFTINSGTVNADRLVLTNGSNTVFTFNGGTLITRGATVDYGVPFIVGVTGAVAAVWDVRSGAGAVTIASNLVIGLDTSGSRLLITNGQTLQVLSADFGSGTASSSIIGRSTASNNLAVVAGAGSYWSNAFNFALGADSGGNTLVVSNGGRLENAFGRIGFQTTSTNNVAVVTGAGSLWSNRTELRVGNFGGFNRLIVSNGGTVAVNGDLVLGNTATSTNNRLIVAGGALRVQNASTNAALNLHRGTNQFDGGTITVDALVMTNTAGVFLFNAGTAAVNTATISNGLLFTVGNGASNANYRLTGGTSSFANNLVISSNAFLSGNGTILGNVTNFGTVAAGTSAGSLRINGNLNLTAFANMTFELGGLIPTNQYDQVTITNFVQFAGTLSLTLIDNFLPKTSDTFTLMTFGSAAGTFANTTNNARMNFTNGLASFKVTYTATNLLLSQVAYLDSDGDGQGDIAEQLAGTSTNNSREFLTFASVAFSGTTNVVLQWQSVTNKLYRLEFSTNLTSAWSAITGPVFTNPATNRTQWVDNGTLTAPITNATRRFYRVGLQ